MKRSGDQEAFRMGYGERHMRIDEYICPHTSPRVQHAEK